MLLWWIGLWAETELLKHRNRNGFHWQRNNLKNSRQWFSKRVSSFYLLASFNFKFFNGCHKIISGGKYHHQCTISAWACDLMGSHCKGTMGVAQGNIFFFLIMSQRDMPLTEADSVSHVSQSQLIMNFCILPLSACLPVISLSHIAVNG